MVGGVSAIAARTARALPIDLHSRCTGGLVWMCIWMSTVLGCMDDVHTVKDSPCSDSRGGGSSSWCSGGEDVALLCVCGVRGKVVQGVDGRWSSGEHIPWNECVMGDSVVSVDDCVDAAVLKGDWGKGAEGCHVESVDEGGVDGSGWVGCEG